jgi:hypothetical protein
MNPYLESALVIAVLIGHGLKVLITWILYPFKPVWYFIYILLLPFIHVGQATWAVVSYPARLFPGSLVEVRLHVILNLPLI